MVITFLEGSCIISVSSALIGCFTVQLNMRGIETAWKARSLLSFTFEIRDRTYCVYLYYGAAVLTIHFTRSDA